MEPVAFVVYSDYLCPWCYNAAVRVRRLEEEFGDAVKIEWRSYLLRPKPSPRRDLERFRAYTRSWLRPAAEPDAGTFRVWEGDAGPPSHSVPPHVVAKAALRRGESAFRRVHDGLLRAYFAESRDVSDDATLRAVWAEAGLPAEAFVETSEPALVRETFDQHAAALEDGVTGVPAVRLRDDTVVIVGAQPLEIYRRWVTRVRAARGEVRAG